MSYDLRELAGLREQILENYSVIDPGNCDALLVTVLRNKTSEELVMYPPVTYGTEYVYEAVILSSLDKGYQILMKSSSPWSNSISAMTRLYDQTCKVLGEKMSGHSK
ncbi:hypothetical protein M436DRAFT_84902 [Aureobasidium namibiae CBS 147.97]|uniref:Uncharacterized protein n=1 Tax=Aureobasidium namibiae CBS 147.97 TaxID=1043004 RepID=A0A074X5I0_9PEZI